MKRVATFAPCSSQRALSRPVPRRNFGMKVWKLPEVPRAPLRQPDLAKMPKDFSSVYARISFLSKNLSRRWMFTLPESNIERFIREIRAVDRAAIPREDAVKFRHFLMFYLFKSAQQGLPACADEIMAIIYDWDIGDSVSIPHAYMNAHANLGRIDEVEKIANRIIRRNTFPYRTTLNQLILCHCKRKDMDSAIRVYESFSEWKLNPTQDTFHILLDAAARNKKMDLFFQLVNEMKVSKLAVNQETFGAVATGFMETYQPDNLVTLLSQMEEMNLKFTHVSWKRAEMRFMRGKQEFVPYVYGYHKDLYKDLPQWDTPVYLAQFFEGTVKLWEKNERAYRDHWKQFRTTGTLAMRERRKKAKEMRGGPVGKTHKKQRTVDRHGKIKGSNKSVSRAQ